MSEETLKNEKVAAIGLRGQDTLEAHTSEELLDLDMALQTDDVVFRTLTIPEWPDKHGNPGKIRIGSLNAGDLIEFNEANEGPAKKTAGLRLIVKSLVNAEGKRISGEKDMNKWRSRNSAVCNRIVDDILDLNGLRTKEQQEKTKNA